MKYGLTKQYDYVGSGGDGDMQFGDDGTSLAQVVRPGNVIPTRRDQVFISRS